MNHPQNQSLADLRVEVASLQKQRKQKNRLDETRHGGAICVKSLPKTSLPEAVAYILHQQPNKVFEVPTIVDALFIEATPKDARNDARNRVSNVLSIGLKNNKWYRGKKGQYSLSQAAVKASVAS
ncbi:MAG: hypothetical protein HC840_27965 [Leptolyngbyaceae cyanobacterium RM2_2_4]|nr:hypothetical protein [Leptolyngbyaceae cyanobacterium RM2_2_4]